MEDEKLCTEIPVRPGMGDGLCLYVCRDVDGVLRIGASPYCSPCRYAEAHTYAAASSSGKNVRREPEDPGEPEDQTGVLPG